MAAQTRSPITPPELPPDWPPALPKELFERDIVREVAEQAALRRAPLAGVADQSLLGWLRKLLRRAD